MKSVVWKRIISMVLAMSMILALFPVMSAQAIEMQPGEFNPATGTVDITFNLQCTQYVNIEILVDGEHFGWLLKDEVLEGYEGDLQPHDPCDAGDLPEESDTSNSAGVATSEEVNIVEEEGQGTGYYVIQWNGSINGKPVVGVNPEADQYEITVSVQPMGYPDLGITPCSIDEETGETIHDGEDWIWTQQFKTDSVVTLDYATILSQAGIMDFLLANQNGFSYQLLLEQIQEFANWINFGTLETLYPTFDELYQAIKEADPVNMIDGSYISQYTDLSIEGTISLAFNRIYNSRGSGDSLGKGFTHSFDYQLEDEDGIVHVYLPGGEEMVFLSLRESEGNDYYSVQNTVFSLKDVSGGYDLIYKDGTMFHFNLDGQLTSVESSQGTTIYSLAYTGDELAEISGLAGVLTLSWENGHISAVSDNTGRTVNYSYSGDLLTDVTNPDGDTLSFSYDGNDYLATATDFEGVEYLSNTYDDSGRVTHQLFVNADVETEYTFTYDDENLVNTCTDSNGWTTAYYYDEYRNLLKTVDDNGTTYSAYSYYMASQLTDNQGNESSHVIDEDGNVTELNYSDGSSISIDYNAFNKTVLLIDDQAETVDFSHMIATLDGQYNSVAVAFAAGLGGDMANAVSVIESYKDYSENKDLSLEDLFYKYLGLNNTTISRDDILADVDAVNIYYLHTTYLEPTVAITERITAYYENTYCGFLSSEYRFTTYYSIMTGVPFSSLKNKTAVPHVDSIYNMLKQKFQYNAATMYLEGSWSYDDRMDAMTKATARYIVDEVNEELDN